MRQAHQWIIGGVIAAAAVTAMAVPAMAQPSGGHRPPPALHLSCGTAPGTPRYTLATPVPVAAKPVVIGPSGKTADDPAPTLVPVPGAPDPGTVVMATPAPGCGVPVVVGPTGVTGPAPAAAGLMLR